MNSILSMILLTTVLLVLAKLQTGMPINTNKLFKIPDTANSCVPIFSMDKKKYHHEPILIDARMKPWYPSELECDPATKRLVDQRWGKYFQS